MRAQARLRVHPMTRHLLLSLACLLVYSTIPLAFGYVWGHREAVETKGQWAQTLARTITATEFCAAAHAVELHALSDTVEGLVGVGFEVDEP